MTKKSIWVLPLFAFGVGLFLFSGAFSGQGSSPVKVKTITVSPTRFWTGDIVTVTITLHNTSSDPYNCSGMTAEFFVFKGTPYTTANRIWQAKQPLTPFAGLEQRNITFAAKFKVPPAIDLPQLHFQARGPVCPPHEFPDQKSLVLKGPPPQPAEVKLTVCITNGKTAPIHGKRDLHVWVTNNHFDKVENITVSFTVEGKGTKKETIRFLGSGMTKKITLNHSWSTAGTRKLSAKVTVAGSAKVWTVEGTHKVLVPGIAHGGPAPNVKCSDGTTRTESDMK